MHQRQPLQVGNVVAVDEGEVWCKFLAGGGCGMGGLHFAAGAGDAPQVAAQLAQHGGFVWLAHIADHYGHLAAHAAQALDALAHGVDPVGGVLVAAVFSTPPFKNGAGAAWCHQVQGVALGGTVFLHALHKGHVTAVHQCQPGLGLFLGVAQGKVGDGAVKGFSYFGINTVAKGHGAGPAVGGQQLGQCVFACVGQAGNAQQDGGELVCLVHGVCALDGPWAVAEVFAQHQWFAAGAGA